MCANGTPASGEACLANGDKACAGCDTGWIVSKDRNECVRPVDTRTQPDPTLFEKFSVYIIVGIIAGVILLIIIIVIICCAMKKKKGKKNVSDKVRVVASPREP